jgi:hypothetical protein
LVLGGGRFVLQGNASTAVNEAVTTGGIQINNQQNVVTLVNAGANVQFTTTGAGTITRNLNGTALFSGIAGTSASGITLGTGVTAVGQAGASNLPNRSIVPWLVVDASASGTGTSFAVSEATAGVGVRALNAATEMTTNTFTANNNLRLNNAAALSAGAGDNVDDNVGELADV